MRNIIILCVIFVLMFGICIWTDLYISKSSANLLVELEKVKESNDIKVIEDFMQKWDRTTKRWFMLTSHDEVENISEHIYALYQFRQQQEEAHYYMELFLVERLIIEMPEKTQFRLTNFF